MTREEAIEELKKIDTLSLPEGYLGKMDEALKMAIEDSKFLEFLVNTINPNEMEQYITMYLSKEGKVNG